MIELFQTYPQLAVFLAIAIGYFVGRIKLLGFSLGSTASVLLAALVIGQLDIKVPDLLKSVSFALFIFTIGYKVGPQFFGSLRKEGKEYIILALFFSAVGLVTAYLIAKGFGFDPGTAAGVLGGALTQSSVIGTADGAISHLAESSSAQKTLESHVAVAYAITYLFGTAGLILFYKLVPPLLGIDLKKEAAEMSANAELPLGIFSWSNRLDLRVYRISSPELQLPDGVKIDRIKRNGELIETNALQAGDIVSFIGRPEDLAKASFGKELYDPDLNSEEGEILDVCILNQEFIGKSLKEISEKLSSRIFLKEITRQGHAIPMNGETIIHKCDLLKLAGPKDAIDQAAERLGYPERPVTITDLSLVGLGCLLGTLLGLLSVKVAGVPITLGVGGGVLVAGLIAGYLRSLHPTFGQIPTSAQWVFTDLGLNLFIACVGLVAGPKAIEALIKMGPSIFVAGIILSLTPHILSAFFGRFVLKMNYVLLFGALTGAGTVTSALNSLKEESDSDAPVLGYTVPYAIGNVLLTVWGTLIVYLV